MNTAKFREIVEKINRAERENQTQQSLESFLENLGQLVNSPQNANTQSNLSSSLNELRNSFLGFSAEFTPQDYERVLTFSDEVFSQNTPTWIQELIDENPMSPSVVRESVDRFSQNRSEVLRRLKQMEDDLKFFEVTFDELPEDFAEIGFQIPRSLFNNDLTGLINELNQIQRMIAVVSEATTGSYEAAKVGTISTTDPLVFLGVAIEVAKHFGIAVTWGIGVWYSVEQIRKIRAETAQIEAFSDDEVARFFDDKIKKQIETSVDAKVKEIIDAGKASKTRKNELKPQLKWVLEALLAKMERGMTIEIRLPPPPDDLEEAEDSSESESESSRNYKLLVETQSQLVFPEASGDPVLAIPESKDED